MAVLRFVAFIIPLSRMIKARFYDYIVMKIRASRLIIFVETDTDIPLYLLCELHCETKGKIRTLVLLVEDFKALPSMSIDDFEKS